MPKPTEKKIKTTVLAEAPDLGLQPGQKIVATFQTEFFKATVPKRGTNLLLQPDIDKKEKLNSFATALINRCETELVYLAKKRGHYEVINETYPSRAWPYLKARVIDKLKILCEKGASSLDLPTQVQAWVQNSKNQETLKHTFKLVGDSPHGQTFINDVLRLVKVFESENFKEKTKIDLVDVESAAVILAKEEAENKTPKPKNLKGG
jgi:hypothetical protein